MKRTRLLVFSLVLSVLIAAGLGCNLLPRQIPTSLPVEATTTPPADSSDNPVPDEGSTMLEVMIFFPNTENYAVNVLPFEEPVLRSVPAGDSLPEAAVSAYFGGPDEAEQSQGLTLITSGFTGLDHIDIKDGVAHVFLLGDCNSGGAAYTIYQPLHATLLQFDSIQYVKIYDQFGETEQSTGQSDSIPFCLEP
ncbi:MAG: GerMN domain-containing protein [Anaerolineales bacterium]|nr:GerMN domain-containing protein [Anaerolineales bacterium]